MRPLLVIIICLLVSLFVIGTFGAFLAIVTDQPFWIACLELTVGSAAITLGVFWGNGLIKRKHITD